MPVMRDGVVVSVPARVPSETLNRPLGVAEVRLARSTAESVRAPNADRRDVERDDVFILRALRGGIGFMR